MNNVNLKLMNTFRGNSNNTKKTIQKNIHSLDKLEPNYPLFSNKNIDHNPIFNNINLEDFKIKKNNSNQFHVLSNNSNSIPSTMNRIRKNSNPAEVYSAINEINHNYEINNKDVKIKETNFIKFNKKSNKINDLIPFDDICLKKPNPKKKINKYTNNNINQNKLNYVIFNNKKPKIINPNEIINRKEIFSFPKKVFFTYFNFFI